MDDRERNGLEVTCYRDEDGEQLMVGVDAGALKLAAVAPADLPRRAVERTVVDCARQLSHYATKARRADEPDVDPADR